MIRNLVSLGCSGLWWALNSIKLGVIDLPQFGRHVHLCLLSALCLLSGFINFLLLEC